MNIVTLAAATAFAVSATFAQANEDTNLVFAAVGPKSEQSANLYEKVQKALQANSSVTDTTLGWRIANRHREFGGTHEWTQGFDGGNVGRELVGAEDETASGLLEDFLELPDVCKYAICLPEYYDHTVIPDDTLSDRSKIAVEQLFEVRR